MLTTIAITWLAATVTLLVGFALGWYSRDRVGTTKGEAALGLPVKQNHSGWSEPAVGSDFDVEKPPWA